MKNQNKKLIVYAISTILIITSFILPPLGIVDNSVLLASGILIGGYEFLFGNSIKSLHIDSTGVHIETHDKEK